MTITSPEHLREEERLIAAAQTEGLSTDCFVREALEKILSDTPEPVGPKESARSLRGIFAKYGSAPSAEEIAQNRADMLTNFPRADF